MTANPPQLTPDLLPPMLLDDERLPRLGRAGPDNLTVAHFDLMKLTVAATILDEAEAAGRLGPRTTVVETSSGTMGLAFARVCAQRQQPLVVVADRKLDDVQRRQIALLGARLEIVETPAPVGGLQQARLDRVEAICDQTPDHLRAWQYHNHAARRAYAPAARHILERLGPVDVLVGTTGTGASMVGLSQVLRLANPGMVAIAVDTHTSRLFGRLSAPTLLGGMGGAIISGNLDHRAFDEVHWVTAPEAFLAARRLHERHAVFTGGSGGAAWLVGGWAARRHPRACVLAVLPDTGHRYLATVHDRRWRVEHDVDLDALPCEPVTVEHPRDAPDRWSRMVWGRRSYQQNLQRPPADAD